MKKTLKIISILLVLIILCALVVTTYQYNTFTPVAVIQDADSKNLVYFQNSYEECRKNFILLADKINKRFEKVTISKLNIESKKDPDLTINYCYVPAQKKFKRLLILSSAVHGIEGYVGSAVQQMFMEELLEKMNLSEMGVLLIHGMNPYGFKYKRRVSENNVDLNRNCSNDSKLYKSINAGYSNLYTMLNPKGEVSLKSIKNMFFQINAIQKIIQYSMGTLRQAILQGQYQYPEGLYFGGNELEPSIKAITPVLKQITENYGIVFNIDLHTGYGARGTLHLFPNPIEDKKLKNDIETIFSGKHIDWGDGDNFYTVTGDFTSYIGRIIPKKYYIPMVFEFGTLDSQTTMGSIKSLHNMIVENQGFHHNYKTKKDEIKINKDILEMYYPTSENWKSKAIEDARIILSKSMKQFSSIER
ncbi:M14 family metallopeptidase [Desulfobacula sp.]|uniref:M14 family metallopeptidase n=1 Tax=Desulfobacula sp. TaxID=2593537 RepID=UPI0025B970A4|nr:M14 family metallopeptidase [Desulfobacula sp.]MBC2703123.1 DUF2817 domain-containing protein [Desulfobacula sp.]